jgi:HEAT repeat protein
MPVRPDPAELRALKDGLHSADAATREEALSRAVDVVARSIVPVLTEALATGSPPVQEHALRTLREVADAATVDEVQRILLDAGPDTAERIAAALDRAHLHLGPGMNGA